MTFAGSESQGRRVRDGGPKKRGNALNRLQTVARRSEPASIAWPIVPATYDAWTRLYQGWLRDQQGKDADQAHDAPTKKSA